MDSRIIAGCGAAIVLIGGILWSFQGSAQMSAPNRKILEALQTAVSTKNPEWLATVENQVAEKRSKKEMSDAEFNAIDSIFAKGKSGKWDAALKESFRLSEGQRPTAEDLASLKNRKIEKPESPKIGTNGPKNKKTRPAA